MDRYLDMRIRPDPEFPPQVLMDALFAKLHRALVANSHDRIGISFPQHDPERPDLGRCLRLHGAGADLDALMREPWLAGMRDHLDLGDIRSIPQRTLHRIVRRVQAKSSPQRLMRRYMRRHGRDEQQARQHFADACPEQLWLPFVQLRSRSTGQTFRLFIDHGEPRADPIPGAFSAYGLSNAATVPWF